MYFRILRLITVPLIDSILDAVYFLHLGSEYILVHMPPSVIKLMCAFLFIAALKDVIISWFIKRLHNHGPKLDVHLEHKFKILEIMTCFIMEDLFQVWLQYFYFEKYRFEQSTTFYVNAGNCSFSQNELCPIVYIVLSEDSSHGPIVSFLSRKTFRRLYDFEGSS